MSVTNTERLMSCLPSGNDNKKMRKFLISFVDNAPGASVRDLCEFFDLDNGKAAELNILNELPGLLWIHHGYVPKCPDVIYTVLQPGTIAKIGNNRPVSHFALGATMQTQSRLQKSKYPKGYTINEMRPMTVDDRLDEASFGSDYSLAELPMMLWVPLIKSAIAVLNHDVRFASFVCLDGR